MVGSKRILAALAVVLAAVSGCSAPAGGASNNSEVSVTSETATSPAPDIDGVDGEALEARIPTALAAAAERGAQVDFALLDRRTGLYVSSGAEEPVPTASVSKLFIADAVLFQAQSTGTVVPADDMAEMTTLLQSSDDNAAFALWYRYGTSDIISQVTERYGLTETTASFDGQWYNTTTTAKDLVGYYAGLLNGSGGLNTASTSVIMDLLRGSTPIAVDGYRQHFGLVEGLPEEPVHAVKQGWMCCVEDRWVHLSTGVVGAEHRYVLVVVSREDIFYGGNTESYPDTALVDVTDDDSATHARDTLTGFVRTLFPSGTVS